MLSSLFQLRKRTAGKAGGSSAPDEGLEVLLEEHFAGQSLKTGPVEFLLVYVRAETPIQLSARAGKIAELAVKQGALVQNLGGSLFLLGFGAAPLKNPPPGNRAQLLAELKRNLGDDTRILHGAVQASFGFIGGETRNTFALLLPKLDLMLGYLSQLNFGQVEEFNG
ncbi:MAG: hypothetical protein U1F98_02305 [Verrucomicrobiota bacterium]